MRKVRGKEGRSCIRQKVNIGRLLRHWYGSWRVAEVQVWPIRMSGIEEDAARFPDALCVNMPRKVEGSGRQLSRSIRAGWKEEGSL